MNLSGTPGYDHREWWRHAVHISRKNLAIQYINLKPGGNRAHAGWRCLLSIAKEVIRHFLRQCTPTKWANFETLASAGEELRARSRQLEVAKHRISQLQQPRQSPHCPGNHSCLHMNVVSQNHTDCQTISVGLARCMP